MKAQSPGTAIGYLAAIFVVGLVIGATIGYTVARKSPSQLPSEQEFETKWLAQYKSKLSLTEDQVRAIQPLLPEAVEDIGGIWYRAIMTMGAVHESIDRKIEPLLDDPQRKKLVQWIQEEREKRLWLARTKLPDEAGGESDIWTAAKSGNLDAINRHLKNGADVNKHDLGFGLTPLTIAVIHGQTQAVDLLLRSGADVNTRQPDGNTTLHAAAFFGQLESVQLLLERGADVNITNHEGEKPGEDKVTDWETIVFIGAILQVELDKEEVIRGRAAVAKLLGQSPE